MKLWSLDVPEEGTSIEPNNEAGLNASTSNEQRVTPPSPTTKEASVPSGVQHTTTSSINAATTNVVFTNRLPKMTKPQIYLAKQLVLTTGYQQTTFIGFTQR